MFLRNKQLKINLVFNHEKVCFEIWLLVKNKTIQKKYWELLKENNIENY